MSDAHGGSFRMSAGQSLPILGLVSPLFYSVFVQAVRCGQSVVSWSPLRSTSEKQMAVRFHPGPVLVSRRVSTLLSKPKQTKLIRRHVSGDWDNGPLRE